MSRQWMIVVPAFAFALALSGCGELCSDMHASADVPMAPAQQADYSRSAAPSASASGAAAVSCVVGTFPLESSRLNNVDKACLDDVVQRLKADPRAHVVVVANADAHERNAGSVAMARGRAVREYLVQESGVDAGRVRVRSEADRKPLATGDDATAQAGNRRCEVWFVPDGVSDPD